MGLTKLKRAFIKEFVDDPACGQAEAARRAGFSAKRAKITACELMKDPAVKMEIDRRLANKLGQVEEKAAGPKQPLTPEVVIQDLEAIAEMCRHAGPGAWQAATLVKVAELKGKYLKMWTEKVEVGPTDELMQLLLEGRKRAAMTLPAAPTATPEGGEGSVQ